MVAWFNWTTFDVIGDLTFNQPFGCLENSTYHPWITAIFNSIKSLVILAGLNQYPPAKRLILLLFSKQINSARESSNIFTKKMVAHRTSSNKDRIDFLLYALNHRSDTEFMTPGEIESTSVILILGGSETSATLLSGAVYYLLKHPRMMQKLVEEIRGQFQKEQDINIVTVSKLTYLQAVIKEALRIFPPVTIGSPRLVEGDGKAIAGIMVPGGVSPDSHQ
jgi:cytochrome P450